MSNRKSMNASLKKYRIAFILPALYSALIALGFTFISYFYYRIAYTPGISWSVWERGFPFPYASGILQTELGVFPVGIIDFSALLLDFSIYLTLAVIIVLLRNRILIRPMEMR